MAGILVFWPFLAQIASKHNHITTTLLRIISSYDKLVKVIFSPENKTVKLLNVLNVLLNATTVMGLFSTEAETNAMFPLAVNSTGLPISIIFCPSKISLLEILEFHKTFSSSVTKRCSASSWMIVAGCLSGCTYWGGTGILKSNLAQFESLKNTFVILY